MMVMIRRSVMSSARGGSVAKLLFGRHPKVAVGGQCLVETVGAECRQLMTRHADPEVGVVVPFKTNSFQQMKDTLTCIREQNTHSERVKLLSWALEGQRQ